MFKNIFSEYQMQVHSVAENIIDYESVIAQQVYSSTLSFNNELLILGHHNSFRMIDMITKRSSSYNLQQQIPTAIGIGYYNNFIAIGMQDGTLLIKRIVNGILEFQIVNSWEFQSYSPNTIKGVYCTNSDTIIVVSLSQVRTIKYTKLLTGNQDIALLSTNSIHHQMGVSTSVYCHQQNQLIVALGNCQIQIYTADLIPKYNYQIQQFDIINEITISHEGRLLAIAQCKLFLEGNFQIDVIDLKRSGKVIKSYKEEGQAVRAFRFLPSLNSLFVYTYSSKYMISLDNDERTFFSQEMEATKDMYILSKVDEYPNILVVRENGILQRLLFEGPKMQQLLRIPFMYFVELRYQELFNYKATLCTYFQSALYSGIIGISKNSNLQSNILNGEQYFEPLFETVCRMSEFRVYFRDQFKYNEMQRKKKTEFPLWIAQWAMRQQAPLITMPVKNVPTKRRKAMKMQLISKQEDPLLQEIEQLRYLSSNCEVMAKNYTDLKASDDRYLILHKLINNIQYQNITMINFQRCRLLFDKRLTLRQQILALINKIERLTYLDLSNNGLQVDDIKQITNYSNLKFLDLSFNEIASSDQDMSFFENIFNDIESINISHNNLTDEEGELLLKLVSSKIRLLDISGNPKFGYKSFQVLEQLIKNHENALFIVEFSPEISEDSMKSLTKSVIQARTTKFELGILLYVANSQKNYWDQSLLEMYSKQPMVEEEDEIKTCCYKFFHTYWQLFTSCFINIRDNTLDCVKQIFSWFCLKKYLLCCYCVFLQSGYGQCITSLLGIKTADYEYNDRKEGLKIHLEERKYWLNFIFWVNFLAFFLIVVLLPIYTVDQCNGHLWSGHAVYAAYTICITIFEVYLVGICMLYKITDVEFSTGPFWKRAIFFTKDLILSQLSKFDVYSDMCFITTVFACGDNVEIGYTAIAIISFSLGTEAYHTLRLLLSRQNGDENYIDYLCNYCAFLEIHMVSSILEKWTIQNTTNFLCLKGLPNRVYAATFRTFAEDIPQFCLQVAYLWLNPKNSNIEILILSLASSIVSLIVSITKSITMTKANRINDKVMMNEVKNKLQLQKEITNKQINDDLIGFLHDYYENFDGQLEVQDLGYGKNNLKIRGQREHKTVLKGITRLEEQVQQNTKTDTRNIQMIFEPYMLFINNKQARFIQNLHLQGKIQNNLTIQILLELELADFADNMEINSEDQQFPFQEGSFIESLKVQAFIADNLINYLTNRQTDVSILDLGCGRGYTLNLMQRICEQMSGFYDYKITGVDHVQEMMDKLNDQIVEENWKNKIQILNIDCRTNILNLGTFDFIHCGFAVQDAEDLSGLIKNDGRALIPVALLPQDHNYMIVNKSDDQYTEQQLPWSVSSGQLQAIELQQPDKYQYYSIQRGNKCSGCQADLELNQFFSPWRGWHLCMKCGSVDDLKISTQEFSFMSNLIFIPQSATDQELRYVDSSKVGKNLFPLRNQKGTKYHVFPCHPCQREPGEEQQHIAAPRFICLNCRPGKYDGIHQDICYDCVQVFLDDKYYYMKLQPKNTIDGQVNIPFRSFEFPSLAKDSLFLWLQCILKNKFQFIDSNVDNYKFAPINNILLGSPFSYFDRIFINLR